LSSCRRLVVSRPKGRESAEGGVDKQQACAERIEPVD
jgi:hypothetical protein